MTPLELEYELQEAEHRESRENQRYESLLKLLDTHFALSHTITHNANFKRSAQVSDYKLMQEQKQKISTQAISLDAKLKADAIARINKRRRQAITGTQT